MILLPFGWPAARSLFLKLKPGDRRAALTMIDDRL
jgi:hypothetical protein